MNEFRKHNEKVLRENAANSRLAPVPEPVDDLVTLISEYNTIQQAQQVRLAAIWGTLAARRGSARFMLFSNAVRWTTNDFRLDPGGRPDISMGRALEGFGAEILSYDLGLSSEG